MAASPSLKLVGHDEPDADARSEPILAPRTRDQRTTVRQKERSRDGGDESWTSTKRAGGGAYTNQPERRPLQCERSTTCESNLKGEKVISLLGEDGCEKGEEERRGTGSIACSQASKQGVKTLALTISLEHSCARFSSSVFWCCSLRNRFPSSSTCLGAVWSTFLGGVPRLKRRCL